MKATVLLILTLISANAQPFPPPPSTSPVFPPSPTNVVLKPPGIPCYKEATTESKYKVVCTECSTVQTLKPKCIQTTVSTSWMPVGAVNPTGSIAGRTLTFRCRERDCRKEFTARDEVWYPVAPKARLVDEADPKDK